MRATFRYYHRADVTGRPLVPASARESTAVGEIPVDHGASQCAESSRRRCENGEHAEGGEEREIVTKHTLST
ncbi:unnamed protein product [Nippostrongylus brasiliensis]|uniref:Uncharacterized protein n=1 Tax=Nippostrongylus brasiliensis TaxID=27835 RepID=A0A0N4Y718_NIPBR|nr:unnamed protein product [Nippostrongylus brasiliensis]